MLRLVEVLFCGLRLIIRICFLIVVRVVLRLMVVVVLFILFFWFVSVRMCGILGSMFIVIIFFWLIGLG